MTKNRKRLTGPFEGFAAEAVAESPTETDGGVVVKTDTFKVTVKAEDRDEQKTAVERLSEERKSFAGKLDDKDFIIYQNDKESFEYSEVQHFPALVKYLGGELSEEAIDLLGKDILSGEKNGKAVQELLDRFNSDEKQRSSRNQYASVIADVRPPTEEQVGNAHARIIRNVMKTKGLSDESTMELLHSLEVVPTSYTLAMFRANKSKV